MPKFRNKLEGLQATKRVWRCNACKAMFESKRKTCDECGSTSLLYFASQEEHKRYCQLLLLQQFNKISNLECQVVYRLLVNSSGQIVTAGPGKTVMKYIADFRYWDKTNDGKWVVEDVKGSKNSLTDVFVLKRRLIQAAYGISIDIV